MEEQHKQEEALTKRPLAVDSRNNSLHGMHSIVRPSTTLPFAYLHPSLMYLIMHHWGTRLPCTLHQLYCLRPYVPRPAMMSP